jgi:3-ketosteroid 9alpha-monooxygenase subunit B
MSADIGPTTGRRVRTRTVTVAAVVSETPDAVTLVYDAPDEPDYRAGQYLTIDPHQFSTLRRFIQLMELLKKRTEPARAYSMASAPHEPLAITIKEECWTPGDQQYPTLLSPFLVREVTAGMAMTVSGFTGSYCLPDDIESRTDHIVHLCAGSGSVPNWSILKSALRERTRLRHTFLYSNTTWDDVIYRDALEALAAAHPDRLSLVHTLTRQTDFTRVPAGVRSGRITSSLVREMVRDYSTAVFYACGPALSPWQRLSAREKGVQPAPRFIESVHDIIRELGVPRGRLRTESYG